MHRHGDILVLFLNSYVKDIHEAEDLMIEAFAQMFVKRRPVSEDDSFRAYLYKTARRLAGKAIKKHRIHIGFEELPFELPGEAHRGKKSLKEILGKNGFEY